jgi:hypothetical protein
VKIKEITLNIKIYKIHNDKDVSSKVLTSQHQEDGQSEQHQHIITGDLEQKDFRAAGGSGQLELRFQ